MNSADLVAFLMRPSGRGLSEGWISKPIIAVESSRVMVVIPRGCVLYGIQRPSVHSVQGHRPSLFNKEDP